MCGRGLGTDVQGRGHLIGKEGIPAVRLCFRPGVHVWYSEQGRCYGRGKLVGPSKRWGERRPGPGRGPETILGPEMRVRLNWAQSCER